MAILYCWSGAAGSGTGADWTNAKTTLTAAFTTEVAGDTIYVAHDHNESTASAVTLTSSGTVGNITKIICVNRAGTVPPVSADRRTTAQVTVTGGVLNFAGFAHYDGIIFRTNNNFLIPSATNGSATRLDNCSLRLTTSTGNINVGSLGTIEETYTEWNNTTVSFFASSQSISIAGAFRWRNTPAALFTGSAAPTTLMAMTLNAGGDVEVIGVDLSAVNTTLVGNTGAPFASRFKFIDCKLHASVVKAATPPAHGGMVMDFVRCGATGNYAVASHRIAGTLTEETTIVRSGGATDGTTPIAWKIVTTANCYYSLPFECPPIAIWNDTTGSAVTATVEGIAATLPTDAEVWLDVEYLGDASSPMGSFVNDGKADLIVAAANQTSSSETWGGSTAAFKMSVSFTAQQAGWIYCRVRCAKASSTFYIDPLVTLS